MQLLSVKIGASSGIIYLKLAVYKYRRALAALRPHKAQPSLGDPQSCQQFLHRKRLGKIVVRSCIKGRDLVPVLAPCAYNYDRHVGPGADALYHIHAVHVRKSKVQKHYIRIMGRSLQHRLVPVCGSEKAVSVGLKRCGDKVAYRLIIFSNQYQVPVHNFRPPLPVM